VAGKAKEGKDVELGEKEQELVGMGVWAEKDCWILQTLTGDTWWVKVGKEGIFMMCDATAYAAGPLTSMYDLTMWMTKQLEKYAIEIVARGVECERR